MRKAGIGGWIVVPVVGFLMMAPLFVAVMVMSFTTTTTTTAAADCLDQQREATLDVPPVIAGPGEGTVRIAQANIKYTVPPAGFRADVATTVALGPDFVSYNEVTRRTDTDLAPSGYAVWREPGYLHRANDGTAVAWRTDRWTKVDAGRTVMLQRGPNRRDRDRSATWVTLQSTDSDNDTSNGGADSDGGLNQVSMISLHHMINPAKFGPDKPERQRLYRAGMEKVQDLVTRLSANGPVFIGGDFNSQYTANDPWGPRRMLAAIGMKATFDRLGAQPTHDSGAIIDYVFYQSSVATPTRQWFRNLNSDHKVIAADLSIGPARGRPSTGAANVVRDESTTPSTTATGVTPGGTSSPAGAVGGDAVRRRLMQIKFAPDDPNYPTMSAEQADNAIAIGQVALNELGLPPAQSRRALEVAIATAIEESKLANLDGGDRDSAGLFQQRPSTGWGTHDQVTNPHLATLAFFGRAEHTSNPGLLDIPGWAQMPITQAAQAVQRSGVPDAYAQWETAAQEIAAVLTGGSLGSPLNILDMANSADAGEECEPEGGDQIGDASCAPTPSAAENGLTPDALLVLRCVEATFGPHTYGGVGDRATNPGSDHPAGRAVDVMIDAWNSTAGAAEGTRIANWVREHAKELGVTYVIWRAKIWSVARDGEGWRPYEHPSGATDPTSLHMDHVHVSVHGNAGTGPGTIDAGDLIVYPVPPQMAATDAHNWHETGPYWSNWHSGTDFSVPCGTPVVAAHAGTIDIDRSQSWAGRWLVKVTTGPSAQSKSLATWYAHMHTLTIGDGDTVRAGQKIGEVGGDSPVDGNVSGCHLHFEVHLKNGSIYGADNVDPSQWLKENVRQ